MTPEQIREVVKMTLDELSARKALKKDNYPEILAIMDKRLFNYFANKQKTDRVGYMLWQLSDDPYIDIIYLHYRDRKTIEWIAEAMDKNVSTIKRNKKRLIKTIYEHLEY